MSYFRHRILKYTMKKLFLCLNCLQMFLPISIISIIDGEIRNLKVL